MSAAGEGPRGPKLRGLIFSRILPRGPISNDFRDIVVYITESPGKCCLVKLGKIRLGTQNRVS